MKQRPPVRLGVLISGTGTNLQAIIDAIERNELRAEIRLVVSNRPAAQGLERARRHGIPARVIEHRRFAAREDFDRALAAALNEHGVELVACAGFMRLLSPVMLAAFPDRIMNIHPALLPAFPGIDAQKAALEYGVRIAGCTVFFVREGVDDGPIIVQAAVPVMPGDDEERLSKRILAQEHRIYPLAIRLYQEGRLKIEGRRVIIAPAPDAAESAVDEHQALLNPPPTASRSH
ncbi:MAG TPA: phosphoribosylglycinamide formyltransferase [Candidatus Binataceae bacterium]|jgi:phosphoribosylglycinamide formyltransferase-1|nr:phosphoribosylglycinamide formyltransferase [Candidatus Binataceae bacterium]